MIRKFLKKQIIKTVSKNPTLKYIKDRTSQILTDKMDEIIEKDIEEQFEAIDKLATQKYRDGAKKYGPWKDEEDNRYFLGELGEIEKEMIDSINYTRMAVIRLRNIDKKLKKLGIEI